METVEQLQCRVSTLEHIEEVRRLLRILASELLMRGEEHDRSKLSPEELDIFAEYGPKLKTTTYGSEQYKQQLEEMGVALKHHYRNNRHHPEHFERGVRDMTLVDLVEMFCDWLAATRRHADGDIFKSIKGNTARFGLDPQVADILTNTAKEYEEVLSPK
jgi:hypothetical protein